MRNPYLNALFAALYIAAVVYAIRGIVSPGGLSGDEFLIPIALLSLFVLSAAVMGLLLFLTPFLLFFDEGRKKEAIAFFFKTLGTFAVFTASVAALLISAKF